MFSLTGELIGLIQSDNVSNKLIFMSDQLNLSWICFEERF